jgi:CubicO group peptidase (beta-lactamase class C family)
MALGAVMGLFAQQSLSAEPRLPEVDRLVEQALAAGKAPGAVVLIGAREGILHRAAYGLRQVEPTPEPMTLDAVFDLASLTKPVATATSVLLLAQRGQIDVLAPVSRTMPEFAGEGKDVVTIAQLLTHTSGLIADNPLADYQGGRDEAWQRICGLKLVAPPGEKFIYSDVGFIVLGMLIERVSGRPLNEFTRANLFKPLGMNETEYCPGPALRERAVPTERREGEWLRGEVHDPRAHALGDVAGHAGLFSTADDLARYARMILNAGKVDGGQLLTPDTIEALLVSREVPGGIRTWGWDRQSKYSSNRGQGLSPRAIGHGGFTGTGMWIDPDLGLFVIFLSSRLHPDGKGTVNPLIGEIGTAAVRARTGAE